MGKRKRGPIETPEFAQMMRRMMTAYARRVGEADDVDLAEMLEVSKAMDEAIAEAVRRQREEFGRSWADIGRGAGMTRQAAFKRWGKPEEQSPSGEWAYPVCSECSHRSSAHGRWGCAHGAAAGTPCECRSDQTGRLPVPVV